MLRKIRNWGLFFSLVGDMGGLLCDAPGDVHFSPFLQSLPSLKWWNWLDLLIIAIIQATIYVICYEACCYEQFYYSILVSHWLFILSLSEKKWLWSDVLFSGCTAECNSRDVFPKQLSEGHTSTDGLVASTELLKGLKLWYRVMFSHKKNWVFLAENMIEDYTA